MRHGRDVVLALNIDVDAAPTPEYRLKAVFSRLLFGDNLDDQLREKIERPNTAIPSRSGIQ